MKQIDLRQKGADTDQGKRKKQCEMLMNGGRNVARLIQQKGRARTMRGKECFKRKRRRHEERWGTNIKK